MNEWMHAQHTEFSCVTSSTLMCVDKYLKITNSSIFLADNRINYPLIECTIYWIWLWRCRPISDYLPKKIANANLINLLMRLWLKIIFIVAMRFFFLCAFSLHCDFVQWRQLVSFEHNTRPRTHTHFLFAFRNLLIYNIKYHHRDE